MPNVKKIIQPNSETGKTIYSIIKREADGFLLNDADGTFSAAPADPYLSLSEHATIKGLYEVSESRAVWNDGRYTVTIYKQSGGSPAPASDTVVGGGEIVIKDDLETYQDVLASTRLAASGYTAPDNAGITAILDDTGTSGVVVAAGSKTGYALSAAGVQAIWDALTSALIVAGSIGKKLADWILGSDNKVLLSANTQTGVTIPTVTTLTGHTPQTGDSFARLGAPAGASVSADLLAIDNLVDDLEMGVDFIEKWILNRLIKVDNGNGTETWTLYDDDGITPLKSWLYTTASTTRAKAT